MPSGPISPNLFPPSESVTTPAQCLNQRIGILAPYINYSDLLVLCKQKKCFREDKPCNTSLSAIFLSSTDMLWFSRYIKKVEGWSRRLKTNILCLLQVVSLAQIVGLDANRRHLDPPGASSIHCNSSVKYIKSLFIKNLNNRILVVVPPYIC